MAHTPPTTPLKISSSEAGVNVECPYPPANLKITKSSGIKRDKQPTESTPKDTYEGGDAYYTSFELLFDTAEKGTNVHAEYTEKLLKLMEAKEYDSQSRTPYCKLDWGPLNIKIGNRQPFKKCILKSIDLNFVLFLKDGTPVRVKVNVTFEEAEDAAEGQNPTTISEARNLWTVTEGETIDWIAYKEFGNCRYWRHIADTNNLIDPKDLYGGQILRIVPLP